MPPGLHATRPAHTASLSAPHLQYACSRLHVCRLLHTCSSRLPQSHTVRGLQQKPSWKKLNITQLCCVLLLFCCVCAVQVPTCAATGITVIPTSEKVNAQVRSSGSCRAGAFSARIGTAIGRQKGSLLTLRVLLRGMGCAARKCPTQSSMASAVAT